MPKTLKEAQQEKRTHVQLIYAQEKIETKASWLIQIVSMGLFYM